VNMGQVDSRGCSVACCTTRERYGGDLEAVTSLSDMPSSASSKPSRASKKFHDGGTGGTSAAQRAQEERGCLISYEPAWDREGEGAGRAFLFNEKSMRPKMLMLRGLREEEEALKLLQVALNESLKTRHVSQQICEGASALSASEWAHRMVASEQSMKALTEQAVEEAVSSALGSSEQKFPPARFEAQYAEILQAVQKLTQERATTVAEEREELGRELEHLEDQIAACFSKMDEAGTGSVTREHFVAFICGHDDGPGQTAASTDVTAADAEDLFNRMSHGRQVLTYMQFKDGITNGCLDILQGNIDLRRVLLKRYRDCWL